MPIGVNCECGQAVSVSRKYAGLRVKCKACGGTISVPAETPPSAPPEAKALPVAVVAAPQPAPSAHAATVRGEPTPLERALLQRLEFDSRALGKIEQHLFWVRLCAMTGLVYAVACGMLYLALSR